MAKVTFGNHSSVIVPWQARDGICKFYCDVLGGRITRAEEDRDFLCLGENFYIAFLYGDVADESEFLRTARSVWLEIKSDNVEETARNIIRSGLVKKLDMPDPHLYFQAPGGQVLRLVGIDEDLSFYEGAGEGPDVAKVKETLAEMATQSYSATIEVALSPEEVFMRVNNVSKWWQGCQFEGQGAIVNDAFTLKSEGGHYSKQKLIEVIPNRKAVWLVEESNLSWLQNNKDEWTNTKMVFEITPKGNATELKFTHEGLVPGKECYSRCAQGWDMLIKGSLYNLLVNGG